MLKNIKTFDGRMSEIFEIGYEKWLENIPLLLQQRKDYYQKLYVQCTYNLHNCTVFTVQQNKELDNLYHMYTKQERSLDNPSSQDRNWVKAQVSKLKNHLSVEQFFEYCKKRFEDEKQRKLEVIE
jgi:hypothetical protein